MTKTQLLGIRLPPELIKYLKKQAKKRALNVSFYLRLLIESDQKKSEYEQKH